MRDAAPDFTVMCSWLIQQSHQHNHEVKMLFGMPGANEVSFSSQQHDHGECNQSNKH